MTVLIGANAMASTLADVRARGALRCGIRSDAPGFAFVDDRGITRGFDIEFCHALAATVLGDAEKIETRPLFARDAFVQLRAGAVAF